MPPLTGQDRDVTGGDPVGGELSHGPNRDAVPLRWGDQGKRRGRCVLGGDLRGRSAFRFKVAAGISVGP